MHIEVVPFVDGYHPDSPTRDTDEFSLMGDIIQVLCQ
jgi:hypothetical protein